MRFTVIQWRCRWRHSLVWVLVLAGAVTSTALGVAPLYRTPSKIHDYAVSVSGGALYALNGRFEGIDSLGGIIQDEFGFVGSFLLPFAGLALMARATRGEEGEGRLELLLARPLDRRANIVAAFAVTAATVVAATVLMGAGVAVGAPDVPIGRALLYAASLGALMLCFAGIAAVAAQFVRHSRSVVAVGAGALFVSYLLRGIGDSTGTWITWLSPLGWAEKVDAFGPEQWWVLTLPVASATAFVAAATVLSAGRDLGDSVVHLGRAGRAASGTGLRRPLGTAIWLQRPAMLGWAAGAAAFMGMFGALARQAVKAIADNRSLAQALGASVATPAEGFDSIALVYLALIVVGFVATAFASVRREETSNRIESLVGASVGRVRWMAAHTVAVLGGALVVGLTGTTLFAVGAAISLRDAGLIGTLLAAGLAYVPAYVAIVGVAAALFGLQPRLYGLVWGVVGAIAFIAFLGPGVGLPMWLRDLSPTQHVGSPPSGGVEAVGLIVLTVVGVSLVVAGFVGFVGRDVPHP